MQHVNVRSNFKLCLDSAPTGIKYFNGSKWVRNCGFIPTSGVGSSRIYRVTTDCSTRELYTGSDLRLAQISRDEFNRNQQINGDESNAYMEIGPHLLVGNHFRLCTKPRLCITAEPDVRPHCLLCVGEQTSSGKVSVNPDTTARIILRYEERRPNQPQRIDLVAVLRPGQQVVFDFTDSRNRVSHSIYRWDGTSIH